MKMRKVLSLIIAAVIVLSIGITAFAVPEPDEEGAVPQEPTQETPAVETETPQPTEEPTEPSPTPTAAPTPTPTATPAPSLITKHPLAENVKAGDTIVFTAYADNTTNVSWFIISPDGSETYAGGLSSTYPGVIVSGENTNKLVINNATAKMNGCSAYARFVTMEGTFLKTDTAKITVTQAAPTPVPTVKPSSTPKPLPTPAPTVKPIPTVKPLPTETVSPVSEKTDTGRPDAKDTDSKKDKDRDNYGRYEKKSHAGAVVFLVLIGLVLASTAVILILYVKGIINLDWLERKLNGQSGEQDDSHSEDDDDEI